MTPIGRLAGRACLVTGGASGIGAALSLTADVPDEADVDRVVADVLRRTGRATDVAQAILFLASDESQFVLGTGLSVDGRLSGTRA